MNCQQDDMTQPFTSLSVVVVSRLRLWRVIGCFLTAFDDGNPGQLKLLGFRNSIDNSMGFGDRQGNLHNFVERLISQGNDQQHKSFQDPRSMCCNPGRSHLHKVLHGA